MRPSNLKHVSRKGGMNFVLANLKKLPPEELAAMQTLVDEWRSQFLG